MEEERESDSKAGSRDQGDSAGGRAGQPQELNLSSAYATLLDQYREALARIHVLEMQNQNLANMVKLSPPPILSQDLRASTGALEAAELAARIEAVERLLAKTAADDSGQAATGKQGATSESHDEVAQLRIQVQSLLGQLSKVNGRHDGTKRAGSRSARGHGWSRWSAQRSSWLNRILKR
jgi:hypothetical protein